MAGQGTPEPGGKCRVQTDEGEQTAIWTGHVWASEDGSSLIDADKIESWEEEAPVKEMEVKMPDGEVQKVSIEVPPASDESGGEEE